MKKYLCFFAFLALAAAFCFSAVSAMANGTITGTFLYNGSGVNQPLDHAYVYLHDASNINPIMGKYFRNAQYILGPTDASGSISVSVPDGTYRIRITRRAPLTVVPASWQEYGAPRPGDYTWHLAGNSPSVTVTDGSVIYLGTIYAHPFSQLVTITGTIKGGTSGAPLAGWFVKATPEPCTDAKLHSNQCGATLWKFYNYSYGANVQNTAYSPQYPAEQLTDSNGNYTIDLPGTGTYYVYACPSPNGCADRWDRTFPGGYTTCTAYTTGYRKHFFYALCPLIINGPTSGVNISAPGY
ncbi:MAG: hypothetical protein M0Z75_01370 [Nitrospiraceae bacterium]|nr:hypothetical protein [Nitrospiraceae bacterium]